LVGERVVNAATEQVTQSYFFHTDHLGSISVITNQNGAVLQRLSYDAWGKSRLQTGADGQPPASPTTRGFAGEEDLTVSGLVHLNGRVYDPTFGRMTSADPTVPDPLDPQAWNRYSYVGNDPLTFTDPTGFSWLSSFFHDVSTFFRAVLANPIARAVVQIAIAAVLCAIYPPSLALAVLSAAGSAAIVTGLSGGKLSQIVQAAAIAGVTAGAFFGVGSLAPISGPGAPTFGTPEFAQVFAGNVAGHAAVGCLSSVASGGQCGPGALSAAAGAGVSPVALQAGLIGGTAISGLVGGFASVAGGAKFENGAITAAFGYLFNACAHVSACTQAEIESGAEGGVNETISPLDFIGGIPYVVGKFVALFTVEAISALEAPAIGTVQAWEGAITAGAVPDEGMVAYRIWGEGADQVGSWLSPIELDSASAARSLLSLPAENTAEFISEVQIPAGTQIQFGTAASAFGQPGGGIQIQLLNRIPLSNFGPGVPLPP
jgi:RHS repeat-associated protein